MSDSTKHPRVIHARAAGKLASQNGKEKDENPYHEDDPLHWLWLFAWGDSEEQKITKVCPQCGNHTA